MSANFPSEAYGKSSASAVAVDFSATTISGVCLLHCLAAPIIASFLPVFAGVIETEWLHRALVVVALPITGLALVGQWPARGRAVFVALAVCGLAALLIGAFVEALHDFETPLTVLGATLLAVAHIWRWSRRNRPV